MAKYRAVQDTLDGGENTSSVVLPVEEEKRFWLLRETWRTKVP